MDMSQSDDATKGVRISRTTDEGSVVADDVLAVEEPLEIRLAYRGDYGVPLSRGISITMRTPGDDEALAAGFLALQPSVVATTRLFGWIILGGLATAVFTDLFLLPALLVDTDPDERRDQ